jgi:hypothetical protein
MNSRHPRSCFDRKTSKVIHENEKALPISLLFKLTERLQNHILKDLASNKFN